MTTPFTYLIGWSRLGKYYYGVRYARGCQPSDLWTKYFTSSKHVKKFREEHGEPDVIEVRRVFETREAARNWEERVLDRLHAVKSLKWLNRQNHGKEFNNDHLIGVPMPRKVIEKRAASQRGAKRSIESRAKMSASCKGRKMTEAAKEANRQGQLGKVLSDDHKKAIKDGLAKRDPSYRDKISSAHKGVAKSEAHCAAISAGHQNRSPEYREKLRQAAKKRWAHKYVQPNVKEH